MGAGSSSGGKKGELLETMADHDESINCMVLSEDLHVQRKVSQENITKKS